MTPMVLCLLLMFQQGEAAAPEHVLKYLNQCQTATAAAIKAAEEEIEAIARQADPNGDTEKKLQAARAQLQHLRKQPAPLARLPLPSKKQDVGVFAPASAVDGRGGRSVDVLEVVDEDDAIIRAWYVPGPLPSDGQPAEDATFVDLWMHGVDTAGLAAGFPARLKQVFHVTGAKSFDTTCGGRSMPLIEPLEIEAYRNQGAKPPDEPSKAQPAR